MKAQSKAQSGLMTEGTIWKQILFFSIPLLIGNMFQQLYNMADSVVVGNYVSDQALAAVGACTPLINMMIGLFMGMATGAGVVISQYYGAENDENLKSSVHTAITISMIGGCLLTVFGISFAPLLVKSVGTSAEAYQDASLYLRLYFLGGIPFLIYNMGAGILRAVGDSKRPLYYLMVTSCLNIILDIVFVVIFHWKIAGVGIATCISQTISAIMVMVTLIKSREAYGVNIRKLGLDAGICKKMMWIGIPSGLQQTIISFSNLMVQGFIGKFGDEAIAGCGAYIKIDGFVLLPVLSFGLAATTFVGQNIGAGRIDRVKKGALLTAAMSVGYIIFVSVLLYIFRWNVVSIFSKNEEVISYGVHMLLYFVPLYVVTSVIQTACGILRGLGNATAPMMIMVGNLCIIRLIWLNIMSHFYNTIDYVFMGYPLTWVTTISCLFIYSVVKYIKKKKCRNRRKYLK